MSKHFCPVRHLYFCTLLIIWTLKSFHFMLYKVLRHKLFVILEPDVVVKRQEALAAARLKMQEELNAQVEKHKEKLRQVRTGFSLTISSCVEGKYSERNVFHLWFCFLGVPSRQCFRPTKLCALVPCHQTHTVPIQLLAPLSV